MLCLFVAVGGHVGGISGNSVIWSGTILGSIGIIRNVSAGSASVQGIDANNPLIIIVDGMDYRVTVLSGTASASYSIAGGTVTFTDIRYDPGATSDIAVTTTTGGRNSAGTFEDSTELTTVNKLVIHGDSTEVTVEGDVDVLDIDGNAVNITIDGILDYLLVGGTLSVDALGDAFIAGNLGSSSSGFVASDQAIEIVAGKFG